MELLFRPPPTFPRIAIADEDRAKFDGNELEDNTFRKTMLNELQGRNVYQGFAPAAEVSKRRSRNKAARKSRRTNRQH